MPPRVYTATAAEDKTVALEYIKRIQALKEKLLELRKNYKDESKKREIPVMEMNAKQNEYDNVWRTGWPRFSQVSHYKRFSEPPYGLTDLPYPTKDIIKKYINGRARGRIIKTALVVNYGVIDKRHRIDEHEPAINAAFNIDQFAKYLRQYLNPKVPQYYSTSPPEYINEEDYEYNPNDYANQNERDSPPSPVANPFPDTPGRFNRQRNRDAPTYATLQDNNRARVTRSRRLAYADQAPAGSPPRVISGQLPGYIVPQGEFSTGGKKRKTRRKKERRTRRKHQKKTRKS